MATIYDIVNQLIQGAQGIGNASVLGQQGINQVANAASQTMPNASNAVSGPAAYGNQLLQSIMSHPQTHQAMAKAAMDQVSKNVKKVVDQAFDPSASVAEASQVPDNGQANPQPDQSQAPQNPPQNPTGGQQSPQTGGLSAQGLQAIGQLLRQASGMPQQNYQKPNFFDYAAHGMGVNTPNYTAATTAAHGAGALVPNVMQNYAAGQLPMTTEQQAQIGTGRYQAQSQALNYQLQSLDATRQAMNQQLNTIYQHPLVNAATGGPSVSKLRQSIQAINKNFDDVQQGLRNLTFGNPQNQKTEGAKQVSNQQEQQRMLKVGKWNVQVH